MACTAVWQQHSLCSHGIGSQHLLSDRNTSMQCICHCCCCQVQHYNVQDRGRNSQLSQEILSLVGDELVCQFDSTYGTAAPSQVWTCCHVGMDIGVPYCSSCCGIINLTKMSCMCCICARQKSDLCDTSNVPSSLHCSHKLCCNSGQLQDMLWVVICLVTTHCSTSCFAKANPL